jgi:TonB family protein
MTAEHALEVQTVFRGVVIGTKYVLPPSRHRSVRSRRHARRCTFSIGSSAQADAPVAPAFLRHLAEDQRGVTHPLITAAGLDGDGVRAAAGDDPDAPYAITLAPGMSGAIYDGARTRALRTEPDGVTPGPRVALARHAHARLDCGAVTFLVAPAEPAAAVPAARFSLSAIENRYHVGTALGVAVLLLLLMMTPADPRALALDVFSTDHGMVSFVIKPPVVPVLPEVVPATGQTQPASGQAAKGPPGAAGSEAARERNRRLAVKGNSQEMRVAQAPQPIDARNAGVLGILSRSDAARSIFERTSALGPDNEDVLGNLVAAPIGLAYGRGALGSLGTGRGGVGTGEGTIGIATFGGGGPGIGPGGIGWRSARVAGTLGTRRAGTPDVIPVIATVRGNLDREIIRRIIRRHINEVRFCYEQQLAAHRDLAGRMVVQFNIAPSGQVLSSVMQSSTLSNVRVESCTLQAVRRWEFPKPEGGGLVNVSYPFVFTPAGGGG